MNRKIQSFLKEKGFKPHPQEKYKMILPFNDKGGIVVFECDEHYEIILGFLSNGEIQPEFLFAGLDRETLMAQFDKLHEVCVKIFDTLIQEGF